MNELIEKENIKIENIVYEINGVQVILDNDLAKLYECAKGIKTINQVVKRNIERLPCDFYFQLTKERFNNLKSQFGTLSYVGFR